VNGNYLELIIIITVKDFRYTPEKLERKSLATSITLSNGNQGVPDTKNPTKNMKTPQTSICSYKVVSAN
jgi:hypothetical protein